MTTPPPDPNPEQADHSAAAVPTARAQAKPRLGRYEIAGLLATGGMAEIWLGRLVGPMGFEHPVVLKRILPHLARVPEFVSMFVDEARITAGIKHPNVALVFELVHDAGELFLVMEYLAGESLAGLNRRLSKQGRTLDPALAAYVIAEACTGLHAAHELSDEQGFPRDLVHRDISPQNIFITYSGQVKLLDFGIAKAANRSTETEAGQVKGKFAYMSPEQCQGQPLDRRSDLFSMGIVLWETSLGTRLFHRGTELLTFQAICEAPVLRPSAACAGYPPQLEQVCMRALERVRGRRYATALELRAALLPVARELGLGDDGETRLGQLMRALFAERVEAKQEMLLQFQAGGLPSSVPAAEVDQAVELPSLDLAAMVPEDAAPEDAAPLEDTALHEESAAPAGSRPSSMARAALAVALAGFVGVAAWGLHSATSSAPSAASNLAASGNHAAASGAAATIHPGTSPASPGALAAGSTPAPAPDAASVSIRVETSPPGAHILLGTTNQGKTPSTFSTPRSDQAQALKLSLPGYQPHEEALTANVSQRLSITLRPLAPRRAPEAKPIPRFR